MWRRRGALMEHGLLDELVGVALVRVDRCPGARSVVAGQALDVRQLHITKQTRIFKKMPLLCQ